MLTAALPPDGDASHAYLFHGPAGAGKRAAARELAAALLSDGAADPVDAARRVTEGVHPDLSWIAPSGASDMLVSDIDEPVVVAATRTPFESRRRVFVIERADTMNEATANRMLKTLEEPADYVHLVLLTDRAGEVLPTILSRCQLVRFEAPTEQRLIDMLSSRVAPEQAKACARLSLGDGEHALVLALGEGPALRASAEAVGRAVISGELHTRPWMELLARAAKLGDVALDEVEERLATELPFLGAKEQGRAKREATEAGKRAQRRARTRALDQGLGLVGLWLRDVSMVVDGVEDLVHNTDRLPALQEDAAEFTSAHALRRAVGLVDETRSMLTMVNATEELAVEALAFRLAQALAR